MTDLLRWLRCHVMDHCQQGMSAADRERLDELRWRTARANRQAATLRLARRRGEFPSWEQMIGEGERRGRQP